jgi:D-sedoheptulose 7-phosphate isomerase
VIAEEADPKFAAPVNSLPASAGPESAPTGDAVASDYLSALAVVIASIPREPLAEAIDLLLAARASGARVYVMGNGGSAATASHIVCDLAKTARVEGRRALRVFSLVDNTPLVTAWSNDQSYESCFAEQVSALVDPGDIVIALSASGNSPNVVAGLAAAGAQGARTIGILGFGGGVARDMVDVAIHVPSNDYGLVEDAHLAIGHAVATAMRQALMTDESDDSVPDAFDLAPGEPKLHLAYSAALGA